MLQNVSREELLEEFIVPSVVPGLTLCLRRLTMPLLHPIGESCAMSIYRRQNIHAVLKENVIDKLKSDYDFILVDSGPHLDAFLKNALASANILFTPLPPATVDFHSSA
ncbi:plasmid partition protein A [Escherichia coli]|nr:plasmid partition protein A [Escherichia coli]